MRRAGLARVDRSRGWQGVADGSAGCALTIPCAAWESCPGSLWSSSCVRPAGVGWGWPAVKVGYVLAGSGTAWVASAVARPWPGQLRSWAGWRIRPHSSWCPVQCVGSSDRRADGRCSVHPGRRHACGCIFDHAGGAHTVRAVPGRAAVRPWRRHATCIFALRRGQNTSGSKGAHRPVRCERWGDTSVARTCPLGGARVSALASAPLGLRT